MKKLRKIYCFFIIAFVCALLLGVSAYAGETSTIGEHRKVSAELFLTDQGEVYSWRKHSGNGYFADPAKPTKIQGLSDIVEISGSLSYGAAIDSKGDLYAWGGPLDLGPSPEKILSDVVSVSVSSDGYKAGAAVTADGSLYIWGEKLYIGDDNQWNPVYKKFGQLYQTDGFTEAAAVCCENSEFSVIMKNGDLYTGRLPVFMKNTDLHNKALQEGPKLTDVVSISSGNYFQLALTKSGDLYTWGEPWDHALGQPSGSLSTPLMTNVSAACADLAGGMAVTTDGQTYLWGTVENLSEKSYFSYAAPTAFDTNGRTFAAMAAQNGTHIGVTAEGELWIWYGKDPCELLGKTGDYSPIPFNPDLSKLPVGYLASRRTIAPGFLVKENGDLYRWVMQEDQDARYLEKIEGISNVVDISASYGYSSHLPVQLAAVTADGSLYIWGDNNSYNSLASPLNYQETKSIPVKSDLTGVVSVHLGAYGGGAALTDRGEMYIWGRLYTGDDKNHQPIFKTIEKPEKVEGLSNLVNVSCDGSTYAAVTRSGDLYLWGLETRINENDATVPNNTTKPHKIAENIRQVELTRQDCFALTKDGRVYRWFKDPTKMTLVEMPPVKSLSCGELFYYSAVTQDGLLYMWGDGRAEHWDFGFEHPFPTLIEYKGGKTAQVSLGWGYTQVIDEEGDLYLCGRNVSSSSPVSTPHPGPDPKGYRTPIYELSGVRVPGKITGSMANLQAGSGKTYQVGQFSDVDEGKWYGIQNQGTIRDAYQLGLMDGMGNGTFAPEGGLRISEALKLACAVRAAYTGDQIPAAAKGQPWYAPYVHYAVSNGMLEIGEFEDYTAYATRSQMAYLFAAALPEDQLTLSDQAILPGDVADSDPYARQIQLLYRAGVLQGEDASGAFHGDSGITRAQAAAIISRLARNGQAG